MVAKSNSLVRRERIEDSRLYGDGFLLLKDDLMKWIESNSTADHQSVRCLELHCGGNLEKILLGDDESIGMILSQLTHLFIHDGRFKCLPSSITSLRNLQRLELYYCTQLQELPPNLGDLLNSLTFLSLHRCSGIKSLPNSIVNLPNFTTLHLKHCLSLTQLPAIPSLVELILYHCSSLQSLPQPLLCNNLQRLHLDCCESLSLSLSLTAHLDVLRHLIIMCCHKIQSLPQSLCTNLEHLHLSLCSQQILLPANFTCFQNLTHLTLNTFVDDFCDHTELSVYFGDLFQLLYLNIEEIKILWLPWSITKLFNLRLLLLPTDFRLQTLPRHLNDSLVISVKDTHVRKTWKELKTEITTFSMPISGSLEEAQFHISSTPRYLQYSGDLGQWIQKSNGLHLLVEILDLNLDDQKFDGYIMHWIGKLPQLTHLYISDASLSLLPLTLFKRIAHLSLSSCCLHDDSIMPCFHCLGYISTLRSLKLLGCINLQAYILDFLPISLTHFSLHSDTYCQPLPHSYMAYMTELYHLNTLELSGFEYLELSLLNMNDHAKLKLTQCVNTNSLPTALQHLEIIHSEVWHEVDQCCEVQVCLNQLINLKTLSVTCYYIKVLPSIGRQKKLQQLQLKDCFNLKKLPSDLDELVELCTLDVSGTRIKSLPGDITKLPKLQHLIVPKCFIFESLPDSFQHKVTKDVTTDIYYEHAGYYNSDYTSTEDNETTSTSVETDNQVVSQESSHNIISEQASLSKPLNPLPDATQVHEENNVLSSSQNQEMEMLPTGDEDSVVPVQDSSFNGRNDAVVESSSHAACNIQDQEMEVSNFRNSDCVGNSANDVAARSLSLNIHDSNRFVENNQQGIRDGEMNASNNLENEQRNSPRPCDSINFGQGGCNSDGLEEGGDQVVLQESSHNIISEQASLSRPLNPLSDATQVHEDSPQGEDYQQGIQGMDNANFENEHGTPPCDSINSGHGGSDKNSQGGEVQLKKTQKKIISKESIEQCRSNNLTIDEAARSLGVGRATLVRKNREYNIRWLENRKRKEPEDENNKEHNTESHSERNSMVPSNSARRDYRTGHNQHIARTGSCSTFDMKATYGRKTVRIDDFSLSSTIEHLKEEVGNKHGIEAGKIELEYLDTTADWILLTEVSDLVHAKYYSESSGKRVIKLLISLKT